MKKTISLLFVAAMVLFGCSNQKVIVTECSIKIEDINLVQTITSKGDTVTKYELVQIFEWTDDFNENIVRDIITKLTENYKDVDGITYSAKEEEGKIISSTIVDYEKIDIKALTEKQKDKTSLETSLKKIVGNLKQSGATCKKV